MGWKCTVCLVTNDDDTEVCVCCEYAKEKDEKKEGQTFGPIFNSSILSSSANSSCPVFKFGAPINTSNTVNDNSSFLGSGCGVNNQIPGFVPNFSNVDKSPTASIETPIIQSVDIHQEKNEEQKQYFNQFNSDFIEYKSFIKKFPNNNTNKAPIGTVWVWGSGECDQLGIKESLLDDDLCLKKPKMIENISKDLNIIDITSGALHNLILTDQGQVLSWGCNDDGALGRLSSRLKAKLDKLNKKINDKDEDEDDDEDEEGEEEEESEDSEKYPNKIVFPENVEDYNVKVKSIIGGDCYSCCLMENGEVYLWGSYKDSGGYIGFPNFQLMSGSLVGYKQYNPVKVPIFGVKKESSNIEGGRRKKIKLNKETVRVVGKAKKILGGENHTIVLTQDMRIFAWGSTEFGQFGIKPVEDKIEKTKYLYPTEIDNKILGFPNNLFIQDIYCGRASTFFVVKDIINNIIQVFACGRNGRNELGVYEKCQENNEVPIVFRPKKVNIADFDLECKKCKSNKPIKQIGGGQYYSALLTCCGEVFVWGMKDCCGLENQLIKNGDESNIKERDIKIPTKIENLKNITKLGFGADSCFAIDINGILFVWGMNLTGQIGITKLIDSEVVLNPQIMNPKTFLSGNDNLYNSNFVLNVVGGSQHSMALIWNGSFSEKTILGEIEQEQEQENIEDERILKRMNAKRFDEEKEGENKELPKIRRACKIDTAKTVIKNIDKNKSEHKVKSKATLKSAAKPVLKPTSKATSKSKITKTITPKDNKIKVKTETKAISKNTIKATKQKDTRTKTKIKNEIKTTSKNITKVTTPKAKSKNTTNKISKTKPATTKTLSKSTNESVSKLESKATIKNATKPKPENTKKDQLTKTKASPKSKTKDELNKKTKSSSKTNTSTKANSKSSSNATTKISSKTKTTTKNSLSNKKTKNA